MTQVTDIIDPSEVFLGEDGTVMDPNDFLGGDPNRQSPPAGDPASDDPPAGDPPAADPPSGGDDPVAYANPAEQALKWLGYESDEVDFGEGNVVKLNELSPEQQADVLAGQLETVVNAYEAEIQNLKTGTPQLETEYQRQVFEFLKGNGDPIKLAEYILQNNPSSMVNTMSDEDVVRKHLGDSMGLEGQDLEDELKFIKDGERLTTYAERARKALEAKGVDLSGLNAEQRQAIQNQEQQAIQEFENEKTQVINFVSSVKDVSGIPVTKDVSDYISTQILPSTHNEDSAFLKSLNNPQKLYRLAFLDNYFEDVVDNLKKTYFEMGKGSVAPPSQGLQKEPIQVRSFRSGSTAAKNSVMDKNGKVDLDKLINAGQTI